MKMPVWLVLLATAAVAADAAAQSSVSGSAEWSVARTDNASDTQANNNSAFWQNYVVGFHSSIIDPRILKYDTEVTFRTGRQRAAGSNMSDQQGRQDDLGFRVGAFALPSGAVPFFIQASRVFTGSTGELSFGNVLPGGLTTPNGAPLNAFETEDRDLNFGGQLRVPGLPRAELSYRRGSSIATGGAERAEQHNADLSANVTRETSRSRHSLRYQRTGYDYVLSQAFTQRIDNIDYDFSATVGGHFQLNARAGQRGMSAASSLSQPLEISDRPYEPPPATDGRTDAEYVTAGISYEPTARLTVRLNGTWDQQRAAIASTNAGLASGFVHAEILPGLSITAEGTSGQRGQLIEGAVTQVTLAHGVAGITYSGGPRWLNGTVSANTGQGVNHTPEGQRGETRSWAREASLSSTLGWFGVGAGYERQMSEDAILDYGNYFSERSRASVTVQSARLSLSGSADRLKIVRGQAATLAGHRQDTFAATLSGRLWRGLTVTGLAGGFRTMRLTATVGGVDQSLFWGAGAQSTLRGSFRAMAWIRSEDITTTSTRFDQRGLNGVARLEYRLRTVNLSLEYRHSYNRLEYGSAPVPSLFRGHQFRFSLTRQFGFAV